MSRLLDIFSKLQKEETPNNFHLNSRVLIIDGMNTFLRSFAVVNRMNIVGHEIGGVVGFLKSIGYAIKLLNPTRVVIIFDGEGGSANRKYLYPNYKSNRQNNRIMNSTLFSNKEEEDDSKYNQITRLVDYLSYLPVLSLSIDNLEADDIIGHLTSFVYEKHNDSEIYIMSSDNDFMQLVNDRVKVYSPIKKKIYQVDTVLSEFKVHPNNFVLYKTLVGDKSDNVPGVYGVGETNVTKFFEFLAQEDRKELDYIFEVCKNPTKKTVIYDRILNIAKDLEVFHKIMNLKNPNISDENKAVIEEKYYSGICEFRKYDFMKLYKYDKMGDAIPNLETWINLFTPLNNYKQL